MKIVAPLILTLGLSFLLYSTKEVWPKSDYDGKLGAAAVSQTRQRGAQRGGASWGGRGLEEGMDQYRSREAGFQTQFQYGDKGQGRSLQNPIVIQDAPAMASGQAR